MCVSPKKRIKKRYNKHIISINNIGGVMVSVLASSMVDVDSRIPSLLK